MNVQNVQPSKPEEIEFPEARHIAMFGDWHGNLHFAKKAIEALPGHVEVAIHTGDFGYNFDDAYLNAVNKSARRKDIVVMFVDGNHENHEWLNAQPIDDDGVRRLRPRVWHLPRGFRWEWCGLKFLAMGGAHSVDRQSRMPGVSWWKEETITMAQAGAAINGGDVDVMISHDAPAGHFIPGLAPSGMFPEAEINSANQHREVIRWIAESINVRYIWHGHYHSKYRTESNGVLITGLDCDSLDSGAVERNIDIVDLSELV